MVIWRSGIFSPLRGRKMLDRCKRAIARAAPAPTKNKPEPMDWVTEGGVLCSGMVAGSLSPQVPWVPLLFYPCNRGVVRCCSLHHHLRAVALAGFIIPRTPCAKVNCAIMLHVSSETESDRFFAFRLKNGLDLSLML